MPRLSPGRSSAGVQPAAVPPAAQLPAQQPAVQAPPPPPPAGLPSPQGLVFDTVLVQPEHGCGLTVPRFTLPDGRSARQAQVTWVPQRYLEMLLFFRSTDGGSSGAVNKLLNKVGLGPTAWVINAAAVTNAEISQAHADFVIFTFKDLLPSNSDAVLGGRTRNVTLIPVASAASICRTRGRSPTTIAFLRACAPQEVPRSWQIQEQADALEEDEVDTVLEDDLAEAEDADADVAFAHELQAGGFASYNATAADETNAREYGIKASEIPVNLGRHVTGT